MYSTLQEIKQAERYYNKFVIKENYERCYDDIQKDRNETNRDSYEEEDWQFIYEFNN